jgi:hypothetical protein
LILVSVDQTKARESGGCFDDWDRIWIANQLGEIIVDDRRRDQVGSGWEVHNGRGCRGRLAACRAKTTTITNSRVDGSSIIRHAVTYKRVRRA